MIVAQSKLLTTLVHEVEDELCVFSIFPRKDLLALEDGGVQLASAVGREAVLHDALDVLATEHLARAIVACTLDDIAPPREIGAAVVVFAMSLSSRLHIETADAPSPF